MSEVGASFVDAVLSGHALIDDIDVWVARWHESEIASSLDEFLGFAEDEGALWAERPEALRWIIAAHQLGRPVATVVEHRGDYALAARGNSTEATELVEWLKHTGRLPA